MKTVLVFLAATGLLAACSAHKKPDMAELPLTDTSLISRGHYLVAISGCNDCHSPKMMT